MMRLGYFKQSETDLEELIQNEVMRVVCSEITEYLKSSSEECRQTYVKSYFGVEKYLVREVY